MAGVPIRKITSKDVTHFIDIKEIKYFFIIFETDKILYRAIAPFSLPYNASRNIKFYLFSTTNRVNVSIVRLSLLPVY